MGTSSYVENPVDHLGTGGAYRQTNDIPEITFSTQGYQNIPISLHT